MRFFIPYLQVILIFLTGSLLAAPANFEEEGEDFIRDLLKAVPEKAKGLSSSKARRAIFYEMQLRNIFKTNATITQRLDNRDDVYSESAINIMVKELEKVARDDKYAKFLLTKIREKRLDEGEQIITMREMAHHTSELQALIKLEELKALAARKEALKKLVTFYQDFTGRQKKTAETITDLGLPDELKFSPDGKVWEYYGGPRDSFMVTKRKVLFIEPTPDAQGKVLAVDIKKDPFLVPMNTLEAAKVAYTKALEASAKEAEAKKMPDPKIVAAQKAAEEKAAKEKAEAYKKSIRENLLQIGAKVKTLKGQGMLPTEFKGLKLKDALQTVKSADGKNSSAWIYLEGRLNVKAGEKKRLLVISPYSVGDDRYLVLLDDGSTAMIQNDQMTQIQSALSALK